MNLYQQLRTIEAHYEFTCCHWLALLFLNFEKVTALLKGKILILFLVQLENMHLQKLLFIYIIKEIKIKIILFLINNLLIN